MTLDLTLLLGGVRSGKSRTALALAEETPGRALFVATAEARDEEMRKRIEIHRQERGTRWETLEAPIDVAGALETRLSGGGETLSVVVIDCLTLWVSNVLLSLDDPSVGEDVLAERTTGLLSTVARHPDLRWIIVSNEVGLGVVPSSALGRHYRDALGRANQLVAERAHWVTLMVAGLAVVLKGGPRTR